MIAEVRKCRQVGDSSQTPCQIVVIQDETVIIYDSKMAMEMTKEVGERQKTPSNSLGYSDSVAIKPAGKVANQGSLGSSCGYSSTSVLEQIIEKGIMPPCWEGDEEYRQYLYWQLWLKQLEDNSRRAVNKYCRSNWWTDKARAARPKRRRQKRFKQKRRLANDARHGRVQHKTR